MDLENKIQCPNCFSPVADEAESCPNCKVDFYNCSNCNVLVLETEKICKNCGSNLESEPYINSDSVVFTKKPIYEFKSLDILTNTLIFLLSAGILFSVINIYANAKEISYLNSNINSGGVLYYEDADFESILIAFSQLFYIIFLLSSIIIYFIWVRHAYRNLASLQLKPAEFSSGWAIGSYFVPILNLFRPYTMMKEIWFGSQPKNSLPDESEFEKIERLTSTTFLKIWWTVFLINGAVGNQSFRLSLKSETARELVTSYWVDIVADAVGIVLSLIIIYMVSNIKLWQSEKIKSKPKRYCQHCGNVIDMEALLCTHCGKQLVSNY
jgi:rRNA maturation endonuclease Nob1